jgi:hypothetical protein
MDDRGERTGLIGVGFLFGFIFLFLLVVCLKATGHAKLAADLGPAGYAVLAAVTGRLLLRRWREAPDVAAFDEDGDVQFCGAVFLLAVIALGGTLAWAAGIDLPRFALLVPLLLCAAAIPARMFVRKLRRRH